MISAFGMFALTYFIYKLGDRNTKKESYVKCLAELYEKIECGLDQLSQMSDNESEIKQRIERRITVHCAIMQYYVKRFPGYNESRLDLIYSLYALSLNLYAQNEHDSFADNFICFCNRIKGDKSSSEKVRFKLDEAARPIEKF